MTESIQLFHFQFEPNKKLIISLKKIFGINFFLAQCISKCFGFSEKAVSSVLTVTTLKLIRAYILKNFMVEEILQKRMQTNVESLIILKTVRGFRHKLHLPVRGQRTRTNRKTCRRIHAHSN